MPLIDLGRQTDRDFNSAKALNIADGTASTDGVNKGQLDAVAAGIDPKDSVRVATDAALPANTQAGAGVGATLTGNAAGILTVDGVATVLGDRILVKDEAAATNNGIYEVTTEGTALVAFVLTRATDADADADVTAGMYCFVEEGTVNDNAGFVLTTNDPITVDTTAQAFGIFSRVTLGGTPTTIEPDDAAAEGISGTAARSDHTHAIAAAAPSVVALTDASTAAEGAATSFLRSDARLLVDTAAPSTTVKSEATAAAQGSATSGLRSDAQIQAATATPSSNLGTAFAQGSSSSLLRADATLVAVRPTKSDKELTASVTASDGASATASTVTTTPAANSDVAARVNGVHYEVGDGVLTTDCYFSGDGGTTARAKSAIVSGDTFHWNGTVAGFELEATDRIDWDYDVNASST